MAKKSKKKLNIDTPPEILPKKEKLIIEEGKYYYTRGGWIAKVIFIDEQNNRCFAVHNPSTPFVKGPVVHELNTGFAMSVFSIAEPPAYTGHPADLIKEIDIQ